MGNINILDESTINQIAAGEVIERPASVVKELMENSIDAKATAVTVEIKDGGSSLIRITDNGYGILKEDVKTAFLRHTTSKIKTAVDLVSVSSLGFRGEALSSIAAVAQVELLTKRREDLFGTKYQIAGGVGSEVEEAGVPDGTTFIVRNLFYNTPARKKFLKTSMTEAGYINDIVSRIALAHPEISIRFINNGKAVIHTSGNGNLKDAIYTIYGRDIAANLIELNADGGNVRISGFIGKPLICRGNRTYENYFINGRYIRSGLIYKAIEEGYRNFMMQHKYPFTVIHMEIEPELLDVNVHPAKLELRFKNYDEIYPLIIHSIDEALKKKELVVEVSLDKDEKKTEKPKPLEKTPEIFEEQRAKVNLEKKETPNPDIKPLEPKKIIFNTQTQKIEKIEVVEKTDEIEEVKVGQVKEENKKVQVAKVEQVKELEKVSETKDTQNDISYSEIITKESDKVSEKSNVSEQMSMFDDKLLSQSARIHHKIVGQVFDTYWIVEYGEKMFIIDQHAAHEKVLFEKTMARLKTRETITQRLDPPIILTLNMREAQTISEYNDYFLKLGYEIEEFGGNEYAVRSVPFDLYSVAKKELLMEMIDELSDDNSIKRRPEIILDRVATMSCKAAVKGNNKLSFAEAKALIDQLLELENPYNCPHGRPTIISMSKYELEKKFKRIL